MRGWLMLAWMAHATACFGASSATEVGAADSVAAYRHLRDVAAGFHGPAISAVDTGVIVLGVLAPATRIAGRELLAAAQLAVDQVNADGGIGGRLCRVIHLSDDQPWHSTAHQLTRLIREDGAAALIGGLDGARAHTAELVVAKLWVPLVSPTAADRSVDVANVPWVFRIAPDEIEQAQALVQAALAQGWQYLRVVVEDDREGRLAVGAIQAAAAASGLKVRIDTIDIAGGTLTEADPWHGRDASLLWMRRETALGWLQAHSRQVSAEGLLLPLHLVAPEILAAAQGARIWAVTLPGDAAPRATFEQQWRQRHADAPSMTTALSYDAARLVLTTMKRVGTNPAAVRTALQSSHYVGVTGGVLFNKLGGRSTPVVVTRLTTMAVD